MNLCIDIGNSAIKAGVFEGKTLLKDIHKKYHDTSWIKSFVEGVDIEKCIVSSVVDFTDENKKDIEDVCKNFVMLTHNTPIPIKNLYATPETLGTDRLAAAVGAYDETHSNTVIIDMGTAITYDIVTEAGEYLGGNISPGMRLRFAALHDYTAKLPLITRNGNLPKFGTDTETAIRCGVMRGIEYEISQFISEMSKKFPKLLVFLTGGSEIDFEDYVKKRIFVNKNLVLKGLNVILSNL
ncbi:MAG: type III pantothenate kinase [Prevotellaceae bacterium]|nr:type III pantothenate kinase [Candidatus Colivivens equi]